jgi:hypothetical protein
MQAAYRPRGGGKFSTSLLDLTAEGGCIETGFLLRERSDGWLQLPTLADWHARVAWRQGSKFGLEFSKPFHHAVMTMILARAGIVDPSAAAQPGNDNAAGQPRGQRPSRRDQILAGIAVPPAASFVAHQFPPR